VVSELAVIYNPEKVALSRLEKANVKTLENLSSPRIRIKPHSPAAMQLDGDPVGEVIEVDFSLKNKALTVLI